MPNWVYNSLVINAKDKDEYNLIHNTLAAPIVSQNSEGEVYNESVLFSFQNIIFVPKDKYEEYFTTHGYSPEKGKTGDTPFNWYRWNNSVWGCKWDAADVEIHHRPEEDTLVYTFSTPWCPPMGAMEELHNQFPYLKFSLEYEEEQGWGGTWGVTDGLIYESEYDIPNSHADYMDRDRECYCTTESDTYYWYKDCPVDTDKYKWNGVEWVLWVPASDTLAADAVTLEKENV